MSGRARQLIALLLAVGAVLGLVGAVAPWIPHRAAGLEHFTATSLLPSTLLSISGIGVCWSYLVYRFIQEGRLSLRAF